MISLFFIEMVAFLSFPDSAWKRKAFRTPFQASLLQSVFIFNSHFS
jgi:hypothetical protein